MKKILITLTLAALCAAETWAAPMGTAFTYQGRLSDGGAPANGNYDFSFLLYDDPLEGNQIANYIVLPAAVSNGVFTVELDFGANAFDGGGRWLAIGVKPGNSLVNYTPLTPRQPLRPTPYALMAGNVPNGAITSAKIANGAVGAQQIAVGGISMSNLASGSISSDKLAEGAVTGDKLASGAAAANLFAAGQSPVAGGGVILSEQSNATNLLNAGYIKLGQVNLVNEGWQHKSDSSGGTFKRFRHSAVWTGTEMLVWGGEFNSAPLDTGVRYNPATDSWTPMSSVNAPAARWDHTAVWTGDQMIVWGGASSGLGNELNTGGRYNPATDTWTPTTTSGAPGGRRAHTAVWSGNAMLIWGGTAQGAYVPGFYGDGAKYNPVTDSWTAIAAANAPLPRALHSAVWTGSEMIIWGGGSEEWAVSYVFVELLSATNYVDGARYNPTSNTWTPISSAGAPAGRLAHSAVWTGSDMIVWGGTDGNQPLGSGGRYNLAANAWVPVSGSGAPSARTGPGVVWTGNRLLVWGGWSGGALGDGASYNMVLDAWTPITMVNAPAARSDHSAIWTGSSMVVWGGADASGSLEFGGRYNPTTDSWTPTSTAGDPSERSDHTAVWTGSEMIVWGGNGGGFRLNNGLRYDPATDLWSPMASSGAPSARTGHSAVWTGGEMLVWGGRDNATTLNTGGRYNPAANVWLPLTTDGAPVARQAHTAVWTGNEMLVWGGQNGLGSGWLGDGARYNPVSDHWDALSAEGAPSPRVRHTAVWTGSEMIVWGGYYAFTPYGDGARYNPASDIWTPMISLGAPSARGNHTACWSGSEMLVWGGSVLGFFGDGGRYDPVANTWRGMSSKGAPVGRATHTATWAGTQMIIWGGMNSTYTAGMSSGGCYLASEDKWTPMTLTGSPSVRLGNTAVWDGTEMLVWGGNHVGTLLKDTYGYAPARSMYLYLKP